jgi:hypothetical protein
LDAVVGYFLDKEDEKRGKEDSVPATLFLHWDEVFCSFFFFF